MNKKIGPYVSLEGPPLQDYASSSRREWLVTNGIGGYASSSLSGSNTRRYHGILVAAINPPTERYCMLSRVEEAIEIGGVSHELLSNQYAGVVQPKGYQYLERYESYPCPTFYFRPRPDVLLRKRIWMAYQKNTTYIEYKLLEAPGPLGLKLTPLFCWKDYHSEMAKSPGFPNSLSAMDGELTFKAAENAPTLKLLYPGMTWKTANFWVERIEHLREMERGLEAYEDLYCGGYLEAMLAPGATLTLTATIEAKADKPDRSYREMVKRTEQLLEKSLARDSFGGLLTLAADQFLVDYSAEKRPSKGEPRRSTIIAGYPWFTDWGRDTMIALPGLCLTTGRPEIARSILLSFAHYVSEGMIPNRFPDRSSEPEYNTFDATLWYFDALWQYVQAVPEDASAMISELWPTLNSIIEWHLRGTRYGISVDPANGLLRGGENGVQLTWMDAKVGDWVVTPRMGMPVEINALWYHALCIMREFAKSRGESIAVFDKRIRQAGRSFRSIYVRLDERGLYDVVNDEGPDAAVRPNQIFAVSLQFSPLSKDEQKSVVRTVEEELLTPYGLRSLSPNHPSYRPHYAGSLWERDGAYHQGTVWPWLLGPFCLAHFKSFGNKEKARAFLEPLAFHLGDAGIGSISEIFDGDSPHYPNGCYAQAWSVAEVLRAWSALSE